MADTRLGEPEAAESPTWVAVDTGGTFTDLVALSDGRLRTLKVPSTPDDPSRAVFQGLGQLLGGSPLAGLLHGTTVATNALLQRRGARVGLITNRGFEDVIEIGRQNRPQLYALVGRRAAPLVDREDRLGIRGRLGPAGDVIEDLDAADLAALPAWADGKDSVAICLLHAYADSHHEAAVADALTSWGGPVSLSSRILPEFREFERTSTVVVNAFVAPLMSTYLGRLAEAADGTRLAIMGSNGGSIPLERAAREPVHTVLSGPAGGVVGALDWGRRAGRDRIITFDMGGTSTDVSLCPGRPLRTREFQIDGLPVAVPVIDIHTVGAGGGSLARVDPGGALKVGPESAGAVPGPICYGQGGTGVTVTDAHVWLGRLPASAFLGGERTLDRDRVADPLARLAADMGTTPDGAAEGIIAVANSAMEHALRVISVERGHDPREFSLVAFGGAGGLHAVELASRIGAGCALIPPGPGLLSAFGMLVAPPTREGSRTVFLRSDRDPGDAMAKALDDLEASAAAALEEDGHDPETLVTRRFVDARYAGQSFELQIPAEGWVDAFHSAHEERYGYARRDHPVEAVTVRAVAEAPPLAVDTPRVPELAPPPDAMVEVRGHGGVERAKLVERSGLGRGATLTGPAIVSEYSGTTWIPGGWQARVDDYGSLVLTRE